MRTLLTTKFLSRALTALVLVGPSASALAQPESAPPPGAPAPSAVPAAPATPTAGAVTPVPPGASAGVPATGTTAEPPPAPRSEAQPAPGSLAESPEPAVVTPPVTDVGIERLPGSAYPEPQTRGLMYGSLWLTFHGLQWPYLPAGPKGERFVIGLSGWGWVDTAYEKFGPWGPNPAIGQSRITYWKGQSRMLARVTPTYDFGDDMFIQGQVELVGTGDQTITRSDVGGADTDDLYLRIGQWNKWDVTAGRFEGWEVFHLGMGLDQNTFERQGAVGPGEAGYPIQFYGLTDNQFRQSGATNLAFHYYPLNILRFELLGMAGTTNSQPTYATRPVAILDLGWLKLKGGVEYTHAVGLQAQNQSHLTKRGVGGAIQFVFNPHIEFGFNAAQGTVVSYDDHGMQSLQGSFTRTSLGGFANVSNGSVKHPLLLGVGALWTRTVDQNDPVRSTAVVDNIWLLQSFVAVQYVAFQQLYIKLVGGYSRGHWLVSGPPPIRFDDEVYSVRMRFAFYF